MQRLSMVVICTVVMLAATGCQSIRRFDQWKCDNLGICICGIRPSCEQACPPSAYPQPVFEPSDIAVPPASTCPCQ